MYTDTIKIEMWWNIARWTLLSSLVLFSGLYIYLINDSVYNTASRQEVEEQATVLEAKVSSLEADYLVKISMINMNFANSLGFVNSAKSATYATLSRPAVSMLAANDEI